MLFPQDLEILSQASTWTCLLEGIILAKAMRAQIVVTYLQDGILKMIWKIMMAVKRTGTVKLMRVTTTTHCWEIQNLVLQIMTL